MATAKTQRIALLSIKPEYISKIISGIKRVEFRKSAIKDDVKYIVCYESRSNKKIVCFFKVKCIVRNTPSALWKKYSKVAGIDKDMFFDYMSNHELGTGIEIEEVFYLKSPIDLNDIDSCKSPPQSFVYISHDDFEKIQMASVKRKIAV